MDDLIDRGVVLAEIREFQRLFDETGDSHDRVAYASAEHCILVIKATQSVNRWIPVEDALPEIGYSVLVTRQTENNTRYVRIASRQDDCWMDSTDEYGKPNPHPVIAWMQMPDAYEPPNNMIGD